MEVISKEKIVEIIKSIEKTKEASYISNADERSATIFENKMPPKIGEYLENVKNSIAPVDVKQIGNIAKNLLEAL